MQLSFGILSLGNQATAWALNLRDSQRTFHCLTRSQETSNKASELGLSSKTLSPECFKDLDYLALLIPDNNISNFLEEWGEYIPESCSLIYAHGQALIKDKLNEKYPQWGHLLLAPKSIASELRTRFLDNQASAGVYSVEYAKSSRDEKFLKSLAKDIGLEIIFPCTFLQETQADLFSEQSLLCSTLPLFALRSFQFLRSKDIPPELAYLECWHEMKLIVDTLVHHGPQEFFDLISPTALVGAHKSSPILEEGLKEKFSILFENISNENFFQQLNETPAANIRSEVHKEWENEELTQVHKKLAPILYKKRGQ